MLAKTNIEYAPDQIYYNINMYNNGVTPIAASYSESRTTPLLIDPSEYYMSVIRFSIPGGNIPIFVAQALGYPGSSNPNVLKYSVTLTRNGTTSGQQNLVLTNYSINKPMVNTFTAQNPKQNPTDPYYFVYSYQLFLDMVNAALIAAYNALPDKGTTTQPPYITFTPVTGLFSLYAQQSYFQNSDPTNPGNLLIWLNTDLYAFFPSFAVYFGGYTPVVPGQNFAIVTKNNLNNTPPSPTGYYQMIQEYSTLFDWNALQSVSFRSNTIPVIQEASTAQSYSGQYIDGSSSNNLISIITDFEPLSQRQAGIYRENLQYYPQGEYRLSNMASKIPLTQIELQAYWTDMKGITYPISILPGNSLSVKILFRKKSFYGSHKIYNADEHSPIINTINSIISKKLR